MQWARTASSWWTPGPLPASAVVAAIERNTPKPIRYVIDTGPDADHVAATTCFRRLAINSFQGRGRLGRGRMP